GGGGRLIVILSLSDTVTGVDYITHRQRDLLGDIRQRVACPSGEGGQVEEDDARYRRGHGRDLVAEWVEQRSEWFPGGNRLAGCDGRTPESVQRCGDTRAVAEPAG